MKKISLILLILLTLCLLFSCNNTITDTNTDTYSDIIADISTDTNADVNTDTNTDTTIDTSSNTGNDTNSDTYSDIYSDNDDISTDIDTESDVIIDTESDIIIDTESDIFSDSDSDTVIDSDNTPPEPQAPNITLTDYNGNTVTLDSLKGKPIVLNFWASWCPPCKAEMPDFEEAYQKYGDDVQFVMVSHLAWGSDTVSTAKAFYEQSGYTFPVYFDTNYEGYFAYDLNSIPRTVIINDDGTVYKAFTGMISYSILENAIENILK